MPLILITGSATTGKSTICDELMKVGYEAYDIDRDGWCSWVNMKTNLPDKNPYIMTKRWHAKHMWLVDIGRVKNMSKKAQSKTIVLCGIARNIDQILSMCQKVIWLTIDEDTIRKRVHDPTRVNRWGKRKYQVEFTIAGNKRLEQYYKDYGAVMIDSTKPFNEVFKKVLGEIKKTES